MIYMYVPLERYSYALRTVLRLQYYDYVYSF